MNKVLLMIFWPLVLVIAIMPMAAPAATTQTTMPVATVEQATCAYDTGSVRVDPDNALTGSEASQQSDPSFGLVAKAVAAMSATGVGEETVSLFHQGTLRGGQVSSTRALSTSTSSDLLHYHPEGQLYEFQVPRSTLNQWLGEGSAIRFNDLHAPSGIVTPEMRILPPASGQMNQCLVPPAP